jgi:hypothetical protein
MDDISSNLEKKISTRYCLYFGENTILSILKTYETLEAAEVAKNALKDPVITVIKIELFNL